MDTRQIERIRVSWTRLAPEADELARTFYDRLFDLDPRLRDLFAAAEMESQSRKFVAMLAELVRLMQQPEDMERALAASGRRHYGYGVISTHYRTVGEALLWALDRVAGEEGLDPETREAWAEAYTRMASVMQRSARPG
ncbi:MAG: globin domain-containing protein [Gemmatimonadota bacterium]|jgi:hemoglobin-like flavoprotein